MTLTTASAKHIRRRLEEPDGGTSLAKASALLAEANRLLDQVKADRARMNALPKPKAPGKDRDERREERNERAAEIRAEVMKRAGSCCEWCQRDGFALEWHHLRGGGDRRHAESVENTVAICFDCHRMWERNPAVVYPMAKDHAIRVGMRDGLRAIEHRLAKVMEARP